MIIGELQGIGAREEWVRDAVCAQVGNWDMWFPEVGESSKAARKLCVGSCPVRAECLLFAVANNIRDGIYGGFSARDRDRLRRRVNPITSDSAGREHRRPNGHGYACRCAVCRRSA